MKCKICLTTYYYGDYESSSEDCWCTLNVGHWPNWRDLLWWDRELLSAFVRYRLARRIGHVADWFVERLVGG